MATCDTNALFSSARGMSGLTPGQYFPLKLALLCQWLTTINPNADCSTATLLSSARCFHCLTEGQKRLVKLVLLCDILGGEGGGGVSPLAPDTPTPTGFDINGSTNFTWTNGSAPQTTVEVWTNVNGAGYSLEATVAGTATSYNRANLPIGQQLCFKLRACNGIACSAFSTESCRVY